jgi:aspartate aminotransferase
MLTKKFLQKSFLNTGLKNFSSLWGHLKPRPADPILGIVEEFKKDPSTEKVNLSAGTYKDNEGKPYILNCVKQAHKIITEKNVDHEYLPIEGLPGFIKQSLKLAYTDSNKALKEERIAGIQGLSGTGSLRIGFEFFAEHYTGPKTILIPNPSWPNHKNIVARSQLQHKEYRYYDFKNKTLDINGLLEDLDKAEERSIVILHVCAHNPTGMDPSQSQWKDILSVVQKKKHFPFFDMAYQGFSSGDLNKDAYALRLFADQGLHLALAQSYAKNFGLYGQRVGCFSVTCDSKSEKEIVEGHVKFIARAQYSNPPKYGAHLVETVLSNPELNAEWHRELKVMADRIASMRQGLYDNLKKQGSKLNWDHIIKQIGMFAYTGLNKDQVNRLKKEFHIYLTDDGRISISGLNTKNVEYVAKCFHEVSK